MPGPSLTQMPTAYQRPRTFWLSPIDGPPSVVVCRRPLNECLVVAEPRRGSGSAPSPAPEARSPAPSRGRAATARAAPAPSRAGRAGAPGAACAPRSSPTRSARPRRSSDPRCRACRPSCPGRAAADSRSRSGAGELVVRPEEGQRMVDRHHRQVLPGHLGDQPTPEAGADHDMVGHDRAARGDDALDPPVLDDQRLRRGAMKARACPPPRPDRRACRRRSASAGSRPASGSQRPPCTRSSSISGNFS